MKKNLNETENGSANAGKTILPIGIKNGLAERNGPNLTEIKNENEVEENTMQIERIETKDVKSGRSVTQRGSEPRSEDGIEKIERESSQRKSKDSIEVIPRWLSEDLSIKLKEQTLDSVSLLKKSANRLLRLMEESASDSDLDRSETVRLDIGRIEKAVECANSLAQTINAQANLVKSVAKLLGK